MNKLYTLFIACFMIVATTAAFSQTVVSPGWHASAQAYEEYIEYLNSQPSIPEYKLAAAQLCLKLAKNPPKTYQDVLAAAEGTEAKPYQWVYANYPGKSDVEMLKASAEDCINVKKDLLYSFHYARVMDVIGYTPDRMFDICVRTLDKYPTNIECINTTLNLIINVRGRDDECLACLKRINRACSAQLTDPELVKIYEPLVAKIRTMIATY